MAERLTRRGVLRGATTLGTLGVFGGMASARGQSDEPFRPERHGFGFRNWSPESQYFDAPPVVSLASLRERVRRDWRAGARDVLRLDTSQFSSPVVEAVATQLRLALGQRAGTDGHCYGMVLSAQRYFQRPEQIPVEREVASEIEAPTVPVEEPSAPVYEEIVRLQGAQFLRFRAWLARRQMYYPERVDTRAVVDDVRAVIDSFGTAAVTLFDEGRTGHQVLAYDSETDADGVTLLVYDPNRSAAVYNGSVRELRFDATDEGLSMRQYGRYTHVLFTRYDQIERATDRDVPNPLDHVTVDRAAVRSSLFPIALVLADAEDVTLGVTDPEGVPLDRTSSPNMDRSRGEYAGLRSRFGAGPGTYEISVFAAAATDYELRTLVANPAGAVVDETRSGSLDPGELERYVLEIPADGNGDLGRAPGGRVRPVVVGATGAAVGLGAGVVGYRALRDDSADGQ